MKKRKNLLFALLALMVVTLGVLLFFYETKADAPDGYVRIDGFHKGAICQALSPGCGLCFGIVKDDQCFVKPAELNDQERQLMNL
jgi:hypothetical protein